MGAPLSQGFLSLFYSGQLSLAQLRSDHTQERGEEEAQRDSVKMGEERRGWRIRRCVKEEIVCECLHACFGKGVMV